MVVKYQCITIFWCDKRNAYTTIIVVDLHKTLKLHYIFLKSHSPWVFHWLNIYNTYLIKVIGKKVLEEDYCGTTVLLQLIYSSHFQQFCSYINLSLRQKWYPTKLIHHKRVRGAYTNLYLYEKDSNRLEVRRKRLSCQETKDNKRHVSRKLPNWVIVQKFSFPKNQKF